MTDIEQKTVFALTRTKDGEDREKPLLVIGIPQGAWDYMKDSRTHTFDLTDLGYPVQLMLFGAKTHADALEVLRSAAKRAGGKLDEQLDIDFSIKGAKKDE